jgi:alanine racemase
MDYLLVDLTDVADAHVGMEVVLLGQQGNESISAIEISDAVGSVCGEVTGAISARVPRYYSNKEAGAHV